MKRLLVALAAIGLTASLGAYAAMPTGAQATEVNVPQDQGGFFIGASALYWQPAVTGNDLDYAVTQAFPGLVNASNQQIHNVDPDYDWGFNVFAGYNFGNGNDVKLEYLRLHTDDSSSTGFGGAILPAHYFANNPFNITYNNYVRSIGAFGVEVSPYDDYQAAKADAEINLDQGDLTVGQYINIGCADQLRLFAGLRYAQIDRDLDTWYSQNPYDAGNHIFGNGVNGTGGALTGDDDSDFKGIGPLVGLNNSYYLGYGIGFTTTLDTGLLIGHVDDDLTLVNYQPDQSGFPIPNGLVDITQTSIHSDDARRVVPVIDAKLGLDYTYPMQNYGSLTLEAGWQVSHYWNAVDGLGGGASSDNAVGFSTGGVPIGTVVSGIANVTPTHRTVDVGYQGPYVTLTYRSTPTA